ncbi:MAG: hypothetical protein IH840_00885, partial [Candidatus Heimdallarchaeota archaeon]|nr:hypothetical protein [Candidatus Heimdallarchaeota archaeon]
DIKQIEPKTFSTMPHLEIIKNKDNPLEIEAALNLPSQALYNYRNYLHDLDSDELYELICEYYKNRRLVDQALADELADEKIHAFLRLVGYFTGNE